MIILLLLLKNIPAQCGSIIITIEFFLHFILFWAFPPSLNMFKLVTESSILKRDELIVFNPML